jgi:O-antigen ligase
LSSVVYWAWTAGLLGDKLPILNGVFADTRSASSYDPHRSVFPLVQDSPNVGAIAFVLLAAFLVPPLIHAGGKRNARLAVVLSVAVLGAVLSTQSRTGLIALAVAPWPFVLRRHDRRLRRRVIAGVLLVAVLALGGYQAFPHGRDFSNPATIISRQQIWRQAVDRFLDKPLLGHGYHYSANANFVEVAVNPPADGSSPPAEYKSVHNEYLGAVVDGGVVGGVVLAYLLLTLSRTGARLSRRGGIAGAEGAGVSCMLLALLVAMTANAALQSAAVSTLFWLFFGIAAARAEQDPTEAGT